MQTDPASLEITVTAREAYREALFGIQYARTLESALGANVVDSVRRCIGRKGEEGRVIIVSERRRGFPAAEEQG